jgi:hypothetical protein
MEHLPYELRVHITTFLEPPGIRALCITGKSFSRLGSDENLFCKLYHRDFIPHIRVHTETDTRNMLAITNSELHERVKESLITRAASVEQLQTLLSNPRVEPGRTWKKQYATLYWTKHGMLYRIRDIFGIQQRRANNLLPTHHLFGVKDFLHYDEDIDFDDNLLHFVGGSIRSWDLIEAEAEFSPDIAAFAADFWCNNELVRMRHLNTFHQIRLINKDQEIDAFLNYDAEDPPNGLMFACVFEGICCWSKATQQYLLMYPMCSLRRLYLQCRDQALHECQTKLELC